MSTGRPVPPDNIPTLTEVVTWPDAANDTARQATPAQEPETDRLDALVEQADSRQAAPAFDEQQFSQRLLGEVQRQVELMLDVRLREALAPILSRAADAMIRDARKELTAAMRDVVSRSIAEELARRD